MSGRACVALALAVVAASGLPPLRAWLEADMARHMLLQFPLLLLAGGLLASALPARLRRCIDACNVHGLSGLFLFLLVSGFWMVPRALDEALLSVWVELAKFGSLLGAGAGLQLSWRAAAPIVQAFFLGNWAWMSAAVGLLYQDVTVRLCNLYLLDQQLVAGRGLVVLALVLPVIWVGTLARSGYLGNFLSDDAAVAGRDRPPSSPAEPARASRGFPAPTDAQRPS
ncbi:hypothetical protein [Aromatoleum aromaticum]|uniref:Transmembrane protein n=1 Tax=Aromatoleum aromaticum (strain DSM 19018 / LMG 30748 / EbN1) TaxID=76114 RepID=Q5P4L2_AROAE|nr:hypothetical protein [Aromatoleum aromaticum]CAI07751.1 hypothetical protein ebA2887 [Aromatoleum aromaticum EbN1]